MKCICLTCLKTWFAIHSASPLFRLQTSSCISLDAKQCERAGQLWENRKHLSSHNVNRCWNKNIVTPPCYYFHRQNKNLTLKSALSFTSNGIIPFQTVNGLFGHGSCCEALNGSSCDYLDHGHFTEQYQSVSLRLSGQRDTLMETVHSNDQVKEVAAFR